MARKTRRKGSVFEAGWIAIDAVVLTAVFLLILLKIIGTFDPTESVVLLNTELLRSKINMACLSGQPQTVETFSFPQQKPTKLFGLTDLFPIFSIRTRGDPQYLLYYEAFPAGEAIGWEAYHNFGYRFISAVEYSKDTENFQEFFDFMKKREEEIKQKASAGLAGGVNRDLLGDLTDHIIISNVMLSDYTNAIPTQEPSPQIEVAQSPDLPKKGDAGEWKHKDVKRDDFFEFAGYLSHSNLEKTAYKYRPCGDNSLCLKTPKGVYRFKLDKQCGDINSIQLEYDARNRAGFYSGLALLGIAVIGTAAIAGPTAIGSFVVTSARWVSGLVSKLPFGNLAKKTVTVLGATYGINRIAVHALAAFLTYKKSDFYIASPCMFKPEGSEKYSFTIEKKRCDELSCDQWINYPIYEVNLDRDNNLVVKTDSEHWQCVETSDFSDKAAPRKPPGDCLVIKVTERVRDFCWTPDPTVKFHGVLDYLSNFDTIALTKTLGLDPVHRNSFYDSNPEMIILNPTKISYSALRNFLDSMERKFWWGWPDIEG